MRQQGMVLLSALVIMLILIQLVLSLMQGVMLFEKTSHQLKKSHHDFYQLESTAYRVVALPVDEQCRGAAQEIHPVLAALHHGLGCSFVAGEKTYLYRVQDLGDFSCLPLQVAPGTYLASHHWLLTMIERGTRGEAIQLRFVTRGGMQFCPGLIMKVVTPGVLSWRHVLLAPEVEKNKPNVAL